MEIGEIREAGSGTEALAAMRASAPDLVYLDVQMPGMDGFTVLASAPEPREFHVVFLTAHEQHALRAFEAEALDYLLKPVDPERFERSLERAKEQIGLRRGHKAADPASRVPLKRLLVQKNGREIFLVIERIDWASRRHYVHARGPEHYTLRNTLESPSGTSTPIASRPDQSLPAREDSTASSEMQPWFHGERRIVSPTAGS